MHTILRRLSCAALLAAAALAALPLAARADDGMWLLNKPPLETLKAKYNFTPSPAWLEHMQKSAVRFSTGGSGSLVSSDGLVMTNHHVGSDMLAKLSTKDHDYLAEGFAAPTRDKELKCPDLELNILWEIQDVTAQVSAAAKPDATAADANAARKKIMTEIEKDATDKSGMKCEIVTLYQGGQYHLYKYKRFTDVRLVFAPEQQIAFFGGDNDNFEYPRFNLDVCFFRIYDDGKPIQPQHHLTWSASGLKDGDLCFVFGHPGRTRRSLTMDHVAFIRDVELPFTLNRMWRTEVLLQGFAGRSEANERMSHEDYFGIQNSRKAYWGLLSALHDPAFLAEKAKAEQDLRAAIDKDPAMKAKYAGAFDDVKKAQDEYRKIFRRYTILSRAMSGSELFAHARTLARLSDELPKPSNERLREFSESALKSVYFQLESDAPVHEPLERAMIANGLHQLAENFGATDPRYTELCAGKSPETRAQELVAATKLKDPAFRKKLIEGGADALKKCDDPLFRFAQLLEPEYRYLRKQYEDKVESVERDAYAKIAQARFKLLGEAVYPDATFTLRMSFGTVKGYDDEGPVPPFCTYAGLYERFDLRKGQPPFDLPKRWLDAKSKLNLKTPFNFVSTCDSIGGNSGSPVVDRAGELVGIIFDSNIHKLGGDIAYTEGKARAVSVDCRGIIEGLRHACDANWLADEITKSR